MPKNKMLILIPAVLVVSLLLFRLLGSSASDNGMNTVVAVAAESSPLNRATHADTKPEPAPAKIPQSQPLAAAAATAPGAPKTIEGWQLANATDSPSSIKLHDRIKQYQAIQFDANSIEPPAVGDTVVLPMLDGKKINAMVETTMVNPNGDISWSGHLTSNGNQYPVSMTYGDNSLFGTVTTVEGSYSLESIAGKGWLYKNPAEAELSQPGTVDTLVPVIHEVNEK